jgi:hypothetical protein
MSTFDCRKEVVTCIALAQKEKVHMVRSRKAWRHYGWARAVHSEYSEEKALVIASVALRVEGRCQKSGEEYECAG